MTAIISNHSVKIGPDIPVLCPRAWGWRYILRTDAVYDLKKSCSNCSFIHLITTRMISVDMGNITEWLILMLSHPLWYRQHYQTTIWYTTTLLYRDCKCI